MKRLSIKPLSVNEAWKGRRFKTDAYKSFDRHLTLILPKLDMPAPPYKFYYKFGFSSRNSDLVNPEKLVTDIICRKYKIDDRYIERMVLEKEIVEKGKEFIEFEIKSIAP